MQLHQVLALPLITEGSVQLVVSYKIIYTHSLHYMRGLHFRQGGETLKKK